jgi:hypothetical protein
VLRIPGLVCFHFPFPLAGVSLRERLADGGLENVPLSFCKDSQLREALKRQLCCFLRGLGAHSILPLLLSFAVLREDIMELQLGLQEQARPWPQRK